MLHGTADGGGHMPYEYKTLKLDTSFGIFSGTDFDVEAYERALNDLGRQGWQLISTFDINKVKGGSKFIIGTFMRASGELP